MMALERVPPRLLSCRAIDHVAPALAEKLGMDRDRHVAAGLVTCDQDDSLYAALDHATKHAEVDVVYAKSFYAGSAHASGPLSGEVLGVIAAADPAEIAEGLWVIRTALRDDIGFMRFPGTSGPAFFPHVIGNVGRYLAPLAGVTVGTPLAYLIAPPVESVLAVDAALKAAQVTLCRFFGPPTETNYGGAYLTGSLADVDAATAAFVEAIASTVERPLDAVRRPERERF